MTQLEIGELERNLAENDSYEKEERSIHDKSSDLREMRDILTALKANEQIGNLEEKRFPLLKK